ncbi:Cullin-domain-containing protein [Mytilinidion resinicola]|uniref:Cullin-domain-containing protein n=1 Tax=Mytilinidion resinicola TaxID=574789 RepID=A0A6A6Y7G5_9PEZI|nr:Cullin-domain-containing protein [Mytilinidion resinicola]KAF2803747.1 Cullin-domain-containing protein [Mytilinidion resinicola]
MSPPPNKADADATWKYIEAGVQGILKHPSDRGEMDMKTWMGLYTAVHNFCTVRKAVGSSPTQGCSRGNRRVAHIFEKELYERLKQLLETHLQMIQNEARRYSKGALLDFYIKEQDRYITAAKQNNHLFRYLNRHWVKQEIKQGRKDIYDVYTLHLVLWKGVIDAATHAGVADAVTQLMERQRNGEIIDDTLIEGILDSFGKY